MRPEREAQLEPRLSLGDLFDMLQACSSVEMIRTTDLRKDWIEQPTVCTRRNLKPVYFDRGHLGKTTLHATALDLRSKDFESKTSKPLVENPCCYSSHRSFIDTFTN